MAKTQTHNQSPVASTEIMDFDALLAEIKAGAAERNAARRAPASLYVKGTVQGYVNELIGGMLVTDSESVTFDRSDMVNTVTVTRKGKDATPCTEKEWPRVMNTCLDQWVESPDVYVTSVDGRQGTVTVLNVSAAAKATVSAIIADITATIDLLERTSEDSPRLPGINDKLTYLRGEYTRAAALVSPDHDYDD